MKEQNGIQIYDQGEKPSIPEGLETNFEVISLFGFKVVEVNGKKMWQTASEEDYRNCEAQRLGIAAADVRVDPRRCQGGSCCQTGPMTCSGSCSGGWPVMECCLAVHPIHPMYYCTCKQ